jgi:3-mercaptopropionate dioxygenase
MTADTAAHYGVVQFIEDAKRIMEAPDGVDNREVAVRALEPLLHRALDGPDWEDSRYATVTANGRPGFDYYRNPQTSLHIYSVLFRPEFPTPVHDHVTWGLIGVYSGTQRTTRYRR